MRIFDDFGSFGYLDTLNRVKRGELRVDDLAHLVGMKRQQLFWLLERLRSEGAEGLVPYKRCRRYSSVVREQVGSFKSL